MVAFKIHSSLKERRAILRERFTREFGATGTDRLFALSIPLRLCPLGAHSDHQGGVVTGFAIDRSIDLVGAVTDTACAEVASVVFNQRAAVHFEHVGERIAGDWANYLRGAVIELHNSKGPLSKGVRGVINGTMPIGGLSSSAAVSIAYLTALAYAQGMQLSNQELVSLVLQIENGYLGLHNGVLDQSVILFSQAEALTVIDCRSNNVQSVALGTTDSAWEFLVVYSGLSRQLTATPFNQRVAECQAAARELLQLSGARVSEHPLLGDVPSDVYERLSPRLSETLRKRARHFFGERERVGEGVRAWSCGDIKRFGELVTQSGYSSIVNYESGSPALIALYEIAAEQSGVYGARFCGGGFQGCCLALIDPAKRESIAAALQEGYAARHPELVNDYSIHRCQTSSVGCIEELQ
jgi:galacturonokinase